MRREITPTLTLPSIVAVIGTHDAGPIEDGGTLCPHCGAQGRYVHTFICSDGTTRGAMSGCIQLFPTSSARESKLAMEAFKRQRSAAEEGKSLASWWKEMVEASEQLGAGTISIEGWKTKIMSAESRRQTWLSKNGYGKFRR